MATHHLTEQIVRSLYKSWWVVTALLLLVGSAVHFELVTEDDLGPLAASTEVAAGENDLMARPGDLDGVASVEYAGLTIALVHVRAIPVNQTGRPIMVVDLAIENRSAVQARIPLAMLELVGPTGRVVAADRFEYTDFGNRLVINPQQVEQVLAVFKLPPGEVGSPGDYTLKVAEAGRWPVELGLDGSVSELAFPTPLSLTSDSAGREPIQYQGLRVELLDATTDLEHGVYRAPIGRHLAVVTVRVIGPSSGSDRQLWRLVDNNGQNRAIRASIIESKLGGLDTTVELVFSYSTDVSELSLMIGRSDRQEPVASFEVQAFE